MAYGAVTAGVFRSLDETEFDLLHRRAFSGGADVRWRFGGDAFELTSAITGSRVEGSTAAILRTQQSSARYMQRPDNDYAAQDPSRTSLSGFAAMTRIKRVTGFIVWDAVYSTRSPGFEVNDLGFMRRADSHDAEFNVRFRWLKPGRVFRRFEFKVGQDLNSTWGWELGSTSTALLFETQLLNYWEVNVDGSVEPVHVDPRALRGGPAIDVPAHGHINGRISSDPRRPFVWNGSWNSTIEASSSRRELTLNSAIQWRPPGPITLSLSGRMNWGGSDRQYITTATVGTQNHYVLGTLHRHEVSAVFRSDLTLSPRLSLQIYAQPLVSARRYSGLKLVSNPRTNGYLNQYDVLDPSRLIRSGPGTLALVDLNRDGLAEFSFADPEAKTMTLRTNFVLRWEFRPGSTVFVVWSQNRAVEQLDGSLSALHDLGDTITVPGTHVFAIKAAYWIGL